MTAPFEFVSESFVLGRGHWYHSNGLGMGFRMTPISSGWGEGEWGTNSKILEFFQRNGKSYYRVDLFIDAAAASPGSFLVQLLASDGLHSTFYNFTLTVTEVVCKGQQLPPVFGQPGRSKPILYFNSTLDWIPKEGDALVGVVAEAYDPDLTCDIELSISNTELLRVDPDSGRIRFTRTLTKAEAHALGKNWIVEVKAVEPKSGKSQSLPLFITNDFP